jgi:hypothetical protein
MRDKLGIKVIGCKPMPRYRSRERIIRFLKTLGKNLLGLALLVVLIWVGLKLAKIPMPTIQPNKAKILDY